MAAEDWNKEDWPKLWLYNLHYFDDLNAEGAGSREHWHRNLMEHWIAENPPTQGVGWEPYPLSLRIVNWIKWGLSGHPLSKEMNDSLAVQTRYLRSRLEFHLLGNHLLANAKALVFSGLWFDGAEADAWFEAGMNVLQSQLAEQVLEDGGHFERSPMYHAIVLEDCLDLINLLKAYGHEVPGWLSAPVAKMQTWLDSMCHPDREIAFFNDAAFAIAPRALELKDYAERLGITQEKAEPSSAIHHAASGYIRVDKGDVVAILDVAPLGPDYLPAHGHADTLSFELSLNGARVIVNSGTSRYDIGPERARQRGTAAHNTLVLDGANSSDVWASFRVGRRARVRDVSVAGAENKLVIRATHDGYAHRKGRVLHTRIWRFCETALEIEDELSGSGQHQAELRFHLHPNVRVTSHGSNKYLFTSDERELASLELDPTLSAMMVETTFHPEFGLARKNSCVTGTWEGSVPARFICKLSYAARNRCTSCF